jgi:hypothetical protein
MNTLAAAVLAGTAAAAGMDLCNLGNFTYKAYDGEGSGKLLKSALGGCDGVEMSSGSGGAAASYCSPRFAVQGGRRLNATFQIQTQALVPAAGGPGAGAATLTGGLYLHFFDANNDSGAWNPQFGSLAPSDTAGVWVPRTATFVVPTTAVTMAVHLAFGAHTFTYKPNRMNGGRATGRVSIAALALADAGPVPPPAATITVDDPALQKALDQAFACLHNSQQSGNFTVGAGYTISGNISPDLTFGLYGVRRTGLPAYVAQMQRQWEWHAPAMPGGEYTAGRVMGQVNWPLGVDSLFSSTGDVAYLRRLLPSVDASLAFCAARADADGLVTLLAKGSGHVGGGADWVDWHTSRLDGRTLQFHLWLVRALRRFAELHEEFQASFGSAATAAMYRARADALVGALRRVYWAGDHWLTNADYADEAAGTVGWLDDAVWSVYHGVANASHGATLWSRVDADPERLEGVPTTWTAFDTQHGKCAWFGRLGGGDIMARYKQGQAARALALLRSFAGTVVEHGNIYEGYDMRGCGLQKCGCTTAGFGDYLEHCGGLIWTTVEGPFGLDFDSRAGSGAGSWHARIEPRFPSSWRHASMHTSVRGSELHVAWRQPGDQLTLAVAKGGADVRVDVVGCGPERVAVVSSGQPFVATCPRAASGPGPESPEPAAEALA